MPDPVACTPRRYVIYLLVTILSPKVRETFRVRVLGKMKRQKVSFVHLQKMEASGASDEELSQISARWVASAILEPAAAPFQLHQFLDSAAPAAVIG